MVETHADRAASVTRMRILLVIDHFGTGGAQRQLVNLGLQLARLGHLVEYFCYYPAIDLRRDLDAAGLQVWQVQKGARYAPSVPFKLRKRLKAGAYDIALSYLDTPNLYLEMAAFGLSRVRVIVSQRARYPEGALPLLKRMIENVHRLADHVVVNSAPQLQRMVEEFPWLGRKSSVIENGVSGDFFGLEREPRTDHRLRLLALGTVVPIKNAGGLIDAVALCRERGTDVSVTWAGRQPDPAHFAALQSRIVQLGLGAAWAWLGMRDDVQELMRSHDALVHPSHSEGFPNAVCEALAAGMPVVASDAGGHAAAIGEFHAGFLFGSRDRGGMAEAIQRLAATDSAEFAAIGRNARRLAEARLSMEACARSYETLFAAVRSGRQSCAV